MYLAENSIIWKAFIKERGADIYKQNLPVLHHLSAL